MFLVEKSSTRPTVLYKVWRLFLLYRRNSEWNSFPDHKKNASSVDTFKYQLKTYPFKQSYDCSSHGLLRSFDDCSFLLRSPAWKDIHTRRYTSSVGVQHGNIHSHKRIYKPCGSPAWKHIHTRDIKAPWESSMETHIHTGYTSSVGVQHGNTHSHKRIIIHIGENLVLTLGGQVEDNHT